MNERQPIEATVNGLLTDTINSNFRVSIFFYLPCWIKSNEIDIANHEIEYSYHEDINNSQVFLLINSSEKTFNDIKQKFITAGLPFKKGGLWGGAKLNIWRKYQWKLSFDRDIGIDKKAVIKFFQNNFEIVPIEEQIKIAEANKARLEYELQNNTDRTTEEIDYLEDQILYALSEIDDLREELYKNKSRNFHSESLPVEINKVELYPPDLWSLIDMVKYLYQDRILFLDSAYDSAKNHPFPDKHLRIAWENLRDLSTVFYDMVFKSESVKDLEKEFKNLSGYDLKISEGKQTKKDKKLMDKRRISFENKEEDIKMEIDITPHIAWGNKLPNLLRVHFYIWHEKEKIIVGHFGGHMENYTSKTRKF